MGFHCQGLTTEGQWSKDEKNLHINTLKLKLAKLAIINVARLKTAKVIPIQMENIAALTHVLKWGRRKARK